MSLRKCYGSVKLHISNLDLAAQPNSVLITDLFFIIIITAKTVESKKGREDFFPVRPILGLRSRHDREFYIMQVGGKYP